MSIPQPAQPAPAPKLPLFIPKGVSFTLHEITPDKHLDKWDVIDGLVRDYTILHPEEVREVIGGNRYMRRYHANKFGHNSRTGMTHGLSMPVGLVFLIKKYYPEVFEDRKQLRRMMRRYPGFRVPEVA